MKKIPYNIPSHKRILVQAISTALLSTPLAIQAQNFEPNTEGQQIEEIVVTGIRKSLQDALSVKRDATGIVDAISSEDVGKFPDKNIADSLQRVPGISVDRSFGEGRNIFVRGTNNDVNRTFMNGQNVASASWWANDNASRGFNYTLLPSELISSLEVYKSPEADHDEGSLGGAVNVHTRKPLDLDARTLQGSIEGVYSELPDTWDPQLSVLGSWTNDEGTFGILGSYLIQEREVRRDGLETFPTSHLFNITEPDGTVTPDVYAVWGGGSAVFNQQRKRQTFDLTMQWRPSDSWDIALKAMQSDLEMNNSNQNYLFLLSGGDAEAFTDFAINVTDPQFIATSDGNRALVGGILENDSGVGAALHSIARDSDIKTAVYDLDVSYDGGTWQAHAQVGFTTAEGGSDRDQDSWFEAPTRSRINLSSDEIEFGYLDIDATDASALTLNPTIQGRDYVRKMEDEETYLQGDIKIDVDWGAVNSIKFGAKLRDHTVGNKRTVGRPDTTHPSFQNMLAISLADVSEGLTPPLHGAAATENSLTRYAWTDPSSVSSVIHPLVDDVYVYSFDQNAFFEINEEITAAYVKADFETGDLRGNIGLRAVHTDQTSSAYQGTAGDRELVSVTRDYTDYLPSLNLIFDLGDGLILRGAVAKAMARPTYTDLSANLLIDATTGSASAGNPYLDGTYSDQFEIGIEWYSGETSLLSATYFNKDLSTYIISNTQVEIIDGEQLSITRPFNADGAEIQGMELQWLQDLGKGFGLIANYTYTDGQIASEVGEFELPGNSENQFNASVYFENQKFSARLSYNYRSESFGGLTDGSQISTGKYDQWDANFNWTLNENVDFFATAVNITNEVIYRRTTDGFPLDFYENGARYSVGVRVAF